MSKQTNNAFFDLILAKLPDCPALQQGNLSEAELKVWNDFASRLTEPSEPLPDPEGKNGERSERINKTLGFYAMQCGELDEPVSTQIVDLLADLAHYCDRSEELADEDDKLSMFEMIEAANEHYRDETDGKGAQFDAV